MVPLMVRGPLVRARGIHTPPSLATPGVVLVCVFGFLIYVL
jgi:hypothetical protein